MRVLFKAFLRVKNHSLLFVFSILALIGLTMFNQLEVLVFGAIAKTGTGVIENVDDRISSIIAMVRRFLGIDNKSFSVIVYAFIFVGIFKALFLFTSKYLTKILAIRICRDLRNQCFAHLQNLPVSFFSSYDRGKLSSRVIIDANQIALSFNSFVTNFIHTPFIFLTTICICLSLSWKLTIVLFLGIPAVIIPLRYITRKIRKISLAMQKRQDSFTSVIIDHLSGIFTIKSYQLERYSIKKYEEENAKLVFFDEKVQKYDMMTRPITHFIMTFMFVSILYIGIHILEISFSDLLVYSGVLHMIYAPFKQFSEENANVQRGVVAAKRLFEILGMEKEGEGENKQSIHVFNELITFSGVSFSYGGEKVLRDINFSLHKGEVLAITGATGSGKSTLLKLFFRLYDLDEGKITVDGVDIYDTTLSSIRNQFSSVSQEPFFFNDTIRANLIFDKKISEEKIISAAKKASIHDFILSLDQGYDTMVEEMGKNLSGGQKQRLSLARALLRESSIILLDEATSSLDATCEKGVANVLSEMKGKITQVIVAHRLSTIQHADKVLFLEDGKVRSFGTLSNVLNDAPAFAAMWEASKLEILERV